MRHTCGYFLIDQDEEITAGEKKKRKQQQRQLNSAQRVFVQQRALQYSFSGGTGMDWSNS